MKKQETTKIILENFRIIPDEINVTSGIILKSDHDIFINLTTQVNKMQFKRKENASIQSFGKIKKSGAYVGFITQAVLSKSTESDSQTLKLEVSTNSGQSGKFGINLFKKDGTENSIGSNQLSQLLYFFDIEDLNSNPRGSIEVTDFDTRITKKVKAETFPDLLNQPIGFCVEASERTFDNESGEEIKYTQLNFVRWFDQETRQTYEEAIGDKPAAWVDAWSLELEEDAHIIKQADSQANKPVPDAVKSPTFNDNFDDDIPDF